MLISGTSYAIFSRLSPIELFRRSFGHFWSSAAFSPKPLSRKSSRTSRSVSVFGQNRHFSVFVGPEPVEVDEDGDDGLALAAVDQILELDPERVLRPHHVENLVFDILESGKSHTLFYSRALHLHYFAARWHG